MIQDSKPGLLKLALSREGEDLLADSLVLTVTFDVRPANKPVTVQSVTAKYYYTSGDTDSPEVKIRIPKEVKKPVSKPGEPNANTVRGGQLAKPAGWEPGRVKENDNAATPPAASLDRQSGEGFGILAYDACPDPLQPFRDYRGDRKLGELLQLFESGKRCGYRQSPRVAISDGEVKVAVTMEAGADSRQAPNFGVTGGRFLSMHRDGNNWTVELLPDRGEHDVVLYVFSGGMLKRMPLAVAAPLALYLQRLTQEEALPPLLEFTIAANYLATHSPEGSKQGPLASSVNKMRQ
ncbi:MAG TPA: hypothetical protein VMJ66_02975 [Geobacteraceae bacterium]|nr:hypothetical protein [Geobacteraceae bacterium]